MRSEPLVEELVDEGILLRHLDHAHSLLSEASNYWENWKFRVFISCIQLSLNIENYIHERSNSTSPSNTSTTVHNNFFIFLRCNHEITKMLQCISKTLHWLSCRHSMIRPSCIVQLRYNHCCLIRLLNLEFSLCQTWAHFFFFNSLYLQLRN